MVTELLNWIEKTEHSIKSCQPVDLTEQKPILKKKYNEFKVSSSVFQSNRILPKLIMNMRNTLSTESLELHNNK